MTSFPPPPPSPRHVVLDTDWFTDVDDVMALRVLLRLQEHRFVTLHGVCLNASFPESVRSVDAFLLAHGVDVPVAVTRQAIQETSSGPSYQKRLAALPSKYAGNEEAPQPAALYRTLLAAAPERLHLLSIGFTENLAELLESPPDAISPLSGRELVAQKCAHLWIMAGKWPRGREYNVAGACGNPRLIAASDTVLRLWPTPVTFLGFEVGHTILAGVGLPQDDLLRCAMEDYHQHPAYSLGGAKLPPPRHQTHFCWDPLLVLLAAGVISPENGRYDTVRGTAFLHPDTGENDFLPRQDGPHRYVVKNSPDDQYAQWLEPWLH